MKAFRIVTVIVTGIISIAVLLTVNVGMTASAGGASSKEIKFSSQRVLFISPHPDDETVSCGGAIIRANAEADAVKVVWINDGDANPQAVAWFSGLNKPKPSDYRALGALRHEEALRAGACLNMNGADEIFLSYPDGATNSLIKKDWNRTHLGANGYTSVSSPYAYNPGAVYQGDSLAKDLTQIIEKFRPTMIVYPDILDKHHDHWATGSFVELAVADAGYGGRRLSYLTHYGNSWPEPLFLLPWLSLETPAGFRSSGVKANLYLSPEEMARKFAAMSQYASQGGPLMPDIGAFMRRNEIFYDNISPQLMEKGGTS